MIRTSLVLAALASLTSISTSGGEQLKIAVSPAYSFAPSNLRIRVRVPPNAQNRALEVVAESGEFYRSSEVQLEGDHAPATIVFEFRSVPSGDYDVYGVLIDTMGQQRAIDRQSVAVISPTGGD